MDSFPASLVKLVVRFAYFWKVIIESTTKPSKNVYAFALKDYVLL